MNCITLLEGIVRSYLEDHTEIYKKGQQVLDLGVLFENY